MEYFLFLPRSQREFVLYILRTSGSKSTFLEMLNSKPQNIEYRTAECRRVVSLLAFVAPSAE
jgi:hypothetical protein